MLKYIKNEMKGEMVPDRCMEERHEHVEARGVRMRARALKRPQLHDYRLALLCMASAGGSSS